jgi:hypothetical protein
MKQQTEDCFMRRLAVLTLALVFSSTAFADVIKKGFTVADGGTLHLNGAYGNIRIVTGGSGVAVEVTRKAQGRSAERRMAEHKITFEQRGNDVVIDSDFDGKDRIRWFGWSDDDYDVQWNIRVPDHYNVDAETSGGWIEIDEIEGTVDARTSGGSIRTGRLGGKSSLKTSGGSITVDGAAAELLAHTSGGSIEIGDTTGTVEAKTSGGSIRLGRVAGEVVARTSGGNINVEDAAGSVDASTSGGSIHAQISRQPKGDSKLSTSGGGVVVTLAPSVAVDLDAEASGGGVTSDVPITVQGRQEDDSLRGKINGGGPRLVLRSSGGGVRVKGL